MKRFAQAIEATCLITGITVMLGLAVAGGFWLWVKWATPEIVLEPRQPDLRLSSLGGLSKHSRLRLLGREYAPRQDQQIWMEGARAGPRSAKECQAGDPAGRQRRVLGLGCREGVTLGGALTRALELRTGEEWEVINMAVPGAFSSVSLATLAHEGMQFKPDVVMTLNGGNDLLIGRAGRGGCTSTSHGTFPASSITRCRIRLLMSTIPDRAEAGSGDRGK